MSDRYDRLAEIDAELENEDQIIRPDWAVGISNHELRAIARQEGVNPTRQDWADGIDPVVIKEARDGAYRDAGKRSVSDLRRERRRLAADAKRARYDTSPAGHVEVDLETGKKRYVLTYRDEVDAKEFYERAERLHARRTDTAKKIDSEKTARLVISKTGRLPADRENREKWLKRPNRVDVAGVDAPANAAPWYR